MKPERLTANLGLGAILAAADVDKVKRRIALGEANGKVAKVAAVETTGKGTKVGDNLGNDLGILALVGPLSGDGGAEGIRSLLTALEALSDPGVLKLIRC